MLLTKLSIHGTILIAYWSVGPRRPSHQSDAIVAIYVSIYLDVIILVENLDTVGEIFVDVNQEIFFKLISCFWLWG